MFLSSTSSLLDANFDREVAVLKSAMMKATRMIAALTNHVHDGVEESGGSSVNDMREEEITNTNIPTLNHSFLAKQKCLIIYYG